MRNCCCIFLMRHFDKLFRNQRTGQCRNERIFIFIIRSRLQCKQCIFLCELFLRINHIAVYCSDLQSFRLNEVQVFSFSDIQDNMRLHHTLVSVNHCTATEVSRPPEYAKTTFLFPIISSPLFTLHVSLFIFMYFYNNIFSINTIDLI